MKILMTIALEHAGAQRGLLILLHGDTLRIDQPVSFCRHPRDLVSLVFEKGAASFSSRMFDGAGHDVAAPILDPHRATNGDIARFGAAAGKDDLVGRRADQSCDLGACRFDRFVRAAAQPVRRRRIAELAA